VRARHLGYVWLAALVLVSAALAGSSPQPWRPNVAAAVGYASHQVALLTRGDERVSVAILTLHDEKHVYGQETLRGIALRLLRGLDSAEAVP